MSELRGFYRLSPAERARRLRDLDVLTDEDVTMLEAEGCVLPLGAADRMVENVLGVFGLPLAVGLNLKVDGRVLVVPMVVEEPSIVAAVSSAAKVAAAAGGFVTSSGERLLVGQVQLLRPRDAASAVRTLQAEQKTLLALANELLPNLVRRGGGVRELQARVVALGERDGDCVVVHLYVDTCDAMGANAVNTLCEQLAPKLARMSGAEVGLRILSNLTERCLVRAQVTLEVQHLATGGRDGAQVRDGVAMASALADACVHRAVTHNKGIMNGIDAVALATGNDWRAIEANAHAWAGRGVGYRPLSRWHVTAAGTLHGELEMPLKLGTVGGNLRVNPGVVLGQRLLGHHSADALARIMAACGLAQNFAALRALSTEGIQRGHMALHARSVTASAGVPPQHFEAVVQAMVASGEVKLWKAEELLGALQKDNTAPTQRPAALPPATPAAASDADADAEPTREIPDAASREACAEGVGEGSGAGKVLLLGEHAVVYGARAVALPLPLATRVRARLGDEEGVWVEVPAWQTRTRLRWDDDAVGLHRPLACILRRLGLQKRRLHLAVDARVPQAMGLGSSAALAVATVRALSALFALQLRPTEVMALAHAAESVAHGRASGVDDTLATLAQPLVFRRGTPPQITPLAPPVPLHLVIGQTNEPSLTASTVARVSAAHTARPALYRRIFDDVDRLVETGLAALREGDLTTLGVVMNLNHGLLGALEVSTPALERAVPVARAHGALGAKLTGGGGGGSMVALCGGETAGVRHALQQAGFATLEAHLPATASTLGRRTPAANVKEVRRVPVLGA